jgi:ABC-2 type transport system permease protein
VVNATVDDLSKDFANSGFNAVLFIPNNIYNSNTVILYSNVWVDDALKAYVGYACAVIWNIWHCFMKKFLRKTIGKVSTPYSLAYRNGMLRENDRKRIVTRKEKRGGRYRLLRLYICFILMYGIAILRGVVEEKTNRVVEIIVSSVKPVQFMVGKIIGIGSVGLLQFILWVGLTLGLVSGAQFILFPEPYVPSELPEMATIGSDAATAKVMAPSSLTVNYAIDLFQTLDGVNWLVMLSAFAFFFIFGYLLYAAIFAAIGAMSDQDTETQQFVIPVTVPLLLPFILLPLIASDPNGSLSFWLSIIPFTSPIAMMARLPFGIPYWQVTLSVALLLSFCALALLLAAKLYKSGILMYGNKPSFKAIMRMLSASNTKQNNFGTIIG